MNTYYLFKTTVECVDAAAEADASKRICDLNSTATLVLLLSTQPPRALCRTADTIGGPCVTRCVSGTLTSAAMLGVKLAQVMVIKVKAEEKRRLESEREALFADLEESLSPELARKVISEHRRKSSARKSEAASDLLTVAVRPSAVAPSIPDVAGSTGPSVAPQAGSALPESGRGTVARAAEFESVVPHPAMLAATRVELPPQHLPQDD